MMNLLMRLGIFLLLVITHSLYAQLSYERIQNAVQTPEEWLTYSGTYNSFRYSDLDQITPENVSQLKAKWVYQTKKSGMIECTPLVVDEVMYITEPPSTVTALDLHTGRQLWTYTPHMPAVVKALGFPPVNRGVAMLDHTIYVATLHAHLIALDAKSGVVRWNNKVADNDLGYAFTCSPLAIDGKIIIGISGGEAGIRGFLDAYDAVTGERLWRFYTIPGEGEPGNETWGGDSWKTGAGPTWITGSYDPELNLIYWGVGNPGPDWNGDVRPGDNLYTCSLVALDADTGKLRWHFQFTPHDTHDWDANQVPILVDLELDGKMRKCVATANRNGFYYILDRVTGAFLKAEAYTKQTWAKGFEPNGRPIVLPNTEPTKEGNLVYPSLQGATNWYSPSYSPQTQLFYVAVREMGAYYYKTDADYEPGEFFLGGGEQALSGDDAYGAIRALDVKTGKRKWEFRLLTPAWSGVMATAGGLVFASSNEGNFFALDAKTGKALWDFQTGGAVRTNPMGFAINGKQHVAIAGGNAFFVFGL